MPLARPELEARARKIKLLALDVDGVLTDGTILVGEGGQVSKRFNIRDGHALLFLPQHGVELAILSGRNDVANNARANDLHIRHLLQGLRKKLPALQSLTSELRLDLSEVAYMGDDINDLPVIQAVGLGATPADACPEALAAAPFVSTRKGGEGAVRELAELLLTARGAWSQVLEQQ